MRISDWSSDVCSSDLELAVIDGRDNLFILLGFGIVIGDGDAALSRTLTLAGVAAAADQRIIPAVVNAFPDRPVILLAARPVGGDVDRIPGLVVELLRRKYAQRIGRLPFVDDAAENRIAEQFDRKSVVWGTRVSVGGDIGGS